MTSLKSLISELIVSDITTNDDWFKYFIAHKDKLFILDEKSDLTLVKNYFLKSEHPSLIHNNNWLSETNLHDFIQTLKEETVDVVVGKYFPKFRSIEVFRLENNPLSSLIVKKIVKQLKIKKITTTHYDIFDYDDSEKQYFDFKKIKGQIPKIGFHGTCNVELKSILKYGLDPSKGISKWKQIGIQHTEEIFFTVGFDIASFYANHAVDVYKNNIKKEYPNLYVFPIIIEFVIPDINLIVPDYDADRVSTKKRYYTQYSPHPHLKSDMSSMGLSRETGKWGYKGRIPSKFIRWIYYYNNYEKKWKKSNPQTWLKILNKYDWETIGYRLGLQKIDESLNENLNDILILKQKVDDFRKQLKTQYQDVIEDLYFHLKDSDILYLDMIRIKKSERKKGIGSKILDQIKKFADNNHLAIVLSPSPEPRYKAKLDKFYKDHGFINNQGRRMDYRLSDPFRKTMVRYPLKEYEEEFDFENLEGTDAIFQYLVDKNKDPEIIKFGSNEYIIWDNFIVDTEFPFAENKDDWLYSTNAYHLVNDLTGTIQDRFNERFWEYPEKLYHATKKENLESIKEKGLIPKDETRGINNRNVGYAIFTSTDSTWISDHYGPIIITILTDLMKKDGFMPYVTKEPEYVESEVINYIAKKIKLWEEDRDLISSSDGTTNDTIIIYKNIPPKYLIINENT